MTYTRYKLYCTESSGYGNRVILVREFYSTNALEKYMKDNIELFLKDGYDVRYEGKSVIMTRDYTRVTYHYETITVDDEGAPWNVDH